MTEPTDRPTDDALIARYREATALDDAAPGIGLRATVLAQAQKLAATRAEISHDAPEAPPAHATTHATTHADEPGAEMDFAAQPLAPSAPMDAANDRHWAIPAVASVAVLGLAGLLALQFGHGSSQEQELALGRHAAPPLHAPAEPSAPQPSASVTAPAADAAPAAPPPPAKPTEHRPARPRQGENEQPAAKTQHQAVGPTPQARRPRQEDAVRATEERVAAEPPGPAAPERMREPALVPDAAPAAPAPALAGRMRAPSPAAEAAPSVARADALEMGANAAPPAPELRAPPPPTLPRQRLLAAAAAGQLAAAREALAQGAPVNAADDTGRTALMLAAQRGDANMARLLQDAGADPLRTDRDGLSAIDYARRAGHEALAIQLSTGDGHATKP